MATQFRGIRWAKPRAGRLKRMGEATLESDGFARSLLPLDGSQLDKQIPIVGRGWKIVGPARLFLRVNADFMPINLGKAIIQAVGLDLNEFAQLVVGNR